MWKDTVSALKKWDPEKKKKENCYNRVRYNGILGKEKPIGEVGNEFTGEKDIKMRLGEFIRNLLGKLEKKALDSEAGIKKGRNMKWHIQRH